MTEPTPSRCRTRFSITPRGQLAVALFHLAAGVAWLSGDASVRLAASLLAAPVLLDFGWKLWAKPRIAIALGPRRGIARSAFRESLALRNDSPRAALRELRLREPRTHVPDAGGAHLPWLPPAGAVRVELTARHPRRGLAVVREFVAETEWPLAFFRWQVEIAVATNLLSEPLRVPFASDALRTAEQSRDARSSPHGETDEFWALREYRDGDDARRVHGRRSASLGELVVAVWHGTDASERCLVVDLRRAPGTSDPRTMRRLDRELGHAAWVVDRWSREGSRFRVVAIQRELSTTTVRDARGAREVLAWLAVAQPVPYRALDDDESRELAALPHRLWLAAGGYRERGAHDATPHGVRA